MSGADMADDEGDSSGEDLTPHDAFALLGHDLRVDILLTLSAVT